MLSHLTLSVGTVTELMLGSLSASYTGWKQYGDNSVSRGEGRDKYKSLLASVDEQSESLLQCTELYELSLSAIIARV